LLYSDPQKRPSARELLQHPWLADVPTPHELDPTSSASPGQSFSFELDNRNNNTNANTNTSTNSNLNSNSNSTNNSFKNERSKFQNGNSHVGNTGSKGSRNKLPSSIPNELTESVENVKISNISVPDDFDDSNDDTAVNSVIAFLKDRISEDSSSRNTG
jgi:serine/threonine protein kinase